MEDLSKILKPGDKVITRSSYVGGRQDSLNVDTILKITKGRGDITLEGDPNSTYDKYGKMKEKSKGGRYFSTSWHSIEPITEENKAELRLFRARYKLNIASDLKESLIVKMSLEDIQMVTAILEKYQEKKGE